MSRAISVCSGGQARWLVLFSLALLLLGCSTRQGAAFKGDGRALSGLKPGTSLAILCSRDSELSFVYSQLLSARLSEESSFKILPEAGIRAVCPDYPLNIVDPEEGMTENDLKQVRDMGKALGVQYAMAVWCEAGISAGPDKGSRTLSYSFCGSLISVTDGFPLATTDFSLSTPIAAREKNTWRPELMKQGVSIVVEAILDRTALKKRTSPRK